MAEFAQTDMFLSFFRDTVHYEFQIHKNIKLVTSNLCNQDNVGSCWFPYGCGFGEGKSEEATV